MKNLSVTIAFCISSIMSLAQWSSVFQRSPNNFETYSLKEVDFVNEDRGIAIAQLTELGAATTPINRIYRTNNGGVTWDSTDLTNYYYIRQLQFVSDSVAYIFATRDVFPPSLPPYQEIGLLSTFDSGVSWIFNDFTSEIPTAAIGYNPLHFINDSVGVFCNDIGTHLTEDYGASWELIDHGYYIKPTSIDNRFIYFELYDVIEYDYITQQRTQITVDGHCEGGVRNSSANSTNCVRYQFAQNGVTVNGYAQHNFATLTFLNENKVLHILDFNSCYDMELTESGLHFASLGRVSRSDDNGSTFFYQESTEPEGFSNAWVKELSFPSDNVGYLLSSDIDPSIGYKIQKTSNAGGVTTDYVGNIIEITASVDEVESFEVNIYPNPATEVLEVNSEHSINQLSLFDMSGEEVLKISPNSLVTSIKLDQLSLGSYVLKIETDSGIVTKKVVRR